MHLYPHRKQDKTGVFFSFNNAVQFVTTVTRKKIDLKELGRKTTKKMASVAEAM